jgi:hypothetical protein
MAQDNWLPHLKSAIPTVGIVMHFSQCAGGQKDERSLPQSPVAAMRMRTWPGSRGRVGTSSYIKLVPCSSGSIIQCAGRPFRTTRLHDVVAGPLHLPSVARVGGDRDRRAAAAKYILHLTGEIFGGILLLKLTFIK